MDGIVSGSFDVTLSTDLYPLDFEPDNGIVISPNEDVLVTSDDPYPATISWNWGSIDRETRVIETSMTILSSDVEEPESIDISIVRVQQDPPLYRVIALSSPFDLSIALTGVQDPEFTLLKVWEVSDLPGEYNFNLSQNSEEYLYIIIHNWSTKKFVLDDIPMSQFISNNFDELLEVDGGPPPLLVLDKYFPSDSLLNVGSGVAVFITPYSSLDPLIQTPINELEGRYQINLTSLGEEEDFPLAGAQIGIEPMVFTWDEASSSDGCSALGFIPGSILILLPLFLLFKKR